MAVDEQVIVLRWINAEEPRIVHVEDRDFWKDRAEAAEQQLARVREWAKAVLRESDDDDFRERSCARQVLSLLNPKQEPPRCPTCGSRYRSQVKGSSVIGWACPDSFHGPKQEPGGEEKRCSCPSEDEMFVFHAATGGDLPNDPNCPIHGENS